MANVDSVTIGNLNWSVSSAQSSTLPDFVPLRRLYLVECLTTVILLVLFLFYWPRVLGWSVARLLRLFTWKYNVWIEIGIVLPHRAISAATHRSATQVLYSYLHSQVASCSRTFATTRGINRSGSSPATLPGDTGCGEYERAMSLPNKVNSYILIS